MKRVKRILAGILGIAIIVGLLLFYDGANGDPLSEAQAKRRAVAYAEKLYPGQTFSAGDALRDGPFVYRVEVRSEESADTHFEVVTRHWTDTSDEVTEGVAEHERLVESGFNTGFRLGLEAAEQAEQVLKSQTPELTFLNVYGAGEYSVFVELGYPDGANFVLDQTFSTEILERVPAKFSAQVSWEGTPTEEDLKEVLKKIKTALEEQGMPMAFYDVILVPEGETEYEERLETIVESGIIAAEEI
ncbi:MAG: hypothetical protein Q4F41_17730 [Eubacteriales bacterium]|nr:hypothetical protein [Eubacteriales bacterium]